MAQRGRREVQTPSGGAKRSGGAPLRCFAVSPPRFEDLVEAELRGLGLDTRTTEGGVEFTATWVDLWRANLWCRVASRVLVRVAEFAAETFPTLDRGLRGLPWAAWLPPAAPLAVSVAKHKTRLYHTGKVAEVALEALGAAAGARLAGEAEEALGLYLRLEGPRVSVSLDTSGEHLHRRGYRAHAGPAPLRENLAAGLLLRAAWDGSEPLYDPFCGSGTLPLEAAHLALGLAPGLRRGFAFERLPSFRPDAWQALRDEASARVLPELTAPIFASDRDVGALALTARAARSAGLADYVQVARLDVAEVEVPAPRGLVATNPPYGVRLGGAASALGSLGRALAGPLRGWRWGVVAAEGGASAERLGLAVRERFSFRSGGLRLQWVQGGPAVAAVEAW